jgi:hypothetical protein
MKKFALLILLPVIFWGCEKTYDSVINPEQTNSIRVTGIAAIDSVNYLTQDSVLTFAISFNSSAQIQTVYFNIVNPAGIQMNSTSINMYDDGNLSAHGDAAQNDNTYSNKYTMSANYENGIYIVKYYVTDIYNNNRYFSSQNFVFDNGQEKFTPVVSDLVAPDTISLSSGTNYYTLHLTVQDSNGVSDIETVFFNSFVPPDYHPSSANPILMYDDGSSQHGDDTAGDGIYSVVVVLSNATEGSYRWEFQAIDRAGLYSNKIIHYVEVTQ